MRGVLLAVTLAGLPAVAWAQTTPPASHDAAHPRTSAPHPVTIAPPTDAQTSGADTLAGESFLLGSGTEVAPTAAPASTPAPDPTPTPAAASSDVVATAQTVAADTAPPTAPAPTGVAAPGITLSESGASEPSASASADTTPPAPHNTARAQATTPPAAPPSGVAAPGVSATASSSHATPARTAIEPANDLERAFVNAARQASARIAFRRTFLASQVALATVSTDANAAPREIRLGPGGQACLIFTSDARATQIMGPRAPRQLMTGRQALERLRGAPLVIININMDPYLTLDTAGIDAFLGAEAAPTAPSAGPSQ